MNNTTIQFRSVYTKFISRLLSFIIFLLLFNSFPPLIYAASLPQTLLTPEVAYSNQAQELHGTIKKMAIELFLSLEEPDPEIGELADGIAVSTFVDLKKLTRTSSFGRYIAEQLMTEFQQHGYQIIEIRKSNNILIREKRGEYGLSRNLDEINSSVAARAMLTGTYTIAGDHVMVNAKILDNKNATLLSSATMLFPRSLLTDQLLADSASTGPRKTEVTYMKKLEL